MGAALLVGGQGLASQCRGGIWSGCAACTEIDASEWFLCIDDDRQHSLPSKAKQGRKRRVKDSEPWHEVSLQHLEELTKQLFQFHDLNGNGLLEESELITLNEQIAMLHHGKETDTAEVRAKYSALFRAKLDPEGRPVPYETFQQYAAEVLDGLDNDPEAQEMILEQFVAEARSGRQAYDMGLTEALELDHENSVVLDAQLEAPESFVNPEIGKGGQRVLVPATNWSPHLSVPWPRLGGGDTGAPLSEDDTDTPAHSPAKGHTEGVAEDVAPCFGPPLEPEICTEAEEDVSFVKDGPIRGASAAKDIDTALPTGGAISSEDTAPGDSPAIPHCPTESSMEDEPVRGDQSPTGGLRSGTLVVEQRKVRRATSCPPKKEAAELAMHAKSPPHRRRLPDDESFDCGCINEARPRRHSGSK